jgi:nitroreductase
MDVFEAIQKRKSVRSYEQTPVPKDVLTKLLEAARMAPSAANIQPWHFIVVTDSQKRKALSKGIFAKFLVNVPTVIVACGDTKASPDWYAVDTSLALENTVLAATGEGLGTCCVGSFNEKSVKELLKIPENLRVVALLAVGYARENVSLTQKIISLVRRRKTLGEIASWEEYGQKLEGKPVQNG